MNAGLYKHNGKPLHVGYRAPVKKEVTAENKVDLTEPLVLHHSTQCFVTPPTWAERLIDYLAPSDSMEICEPQSGTGNLLSALLEYGHPMSKIRAVELNHDLCNLLDKRFPDLILHRGCFLDYALTAGRSFDAIVMNPPYTKNQAKHHIDAACTLLKPDGQLFAIVPANFKHPAAYDIEDIPGGEFAGTGVHTKIIEINESEL